MISLTTSEKIPEETIEDTVGFNFFEDEELRDHPRLRRILTMLVRPKPLFYGVLHRNDGSDLLLTGAVLMVAARHDRAEALSRIARMRAKRD